MGMSASQARLLQLEAEQTNLEYQGQQINQERSVLSQQAAQLTNSLLDLQIPTPPSKNDYTTVKYTGMDGATEFSLGIVKPSGTAYEVEIQTTQTGSALEQLAGTALVEIKENSYWLEVPYEDNPFDAGNVVGYEDAITYNNDIISDLRSYTDQTEEVLQSIKELEESNKTFKEKLKSFEKANIADYYVMDNGKVRKATADDLEEDMYGEKWLKDGLTLYQASDKDNGMKINEIKSLYIEGCEAFDFDIDKLKKLYPKYDWEGYAQAVRNSFGNGDTDIQPSDFYVYFKTDGDRTEVRFAMKSDVGSLSGGIDDGFTNTYAYTPNGQFLKSEFVDGVNLKFDASGRITDMDMPIYGTDKTKPISRKTIHLEATTVTDDAAYNEAMAQYKYAQYEYDLEQSKINAKTEAIQRQDRNLELKLQQLDSERKQITTEIEALDTVIKDNIEQSYKTFSG